MKIVGIIAEYNPFHNGHKYHIEEAKKRSGCDSAVVILSGDFVQRGTPAIMPKHLRAALALQNGADLILELPVCYATGSAEFFSMGAVSILDSLGCIDSLCFGAETDDLSLLRRIADLLVQEPESYQDALKYALKQGIAFPKAREQGIMAALREEPDTCIKAISALQNPNNILAIEYLKALKRRNSDIQPVLLKREGAGYHSSEVPKSTTNESPLDSPLASATALRALLSRLPISSWKHLIPDQSYSLLQNLAEKEFPVWEEDLSLLMKYQLSKETTDSLSEYADISEELASRIINNRYSFTTYREFTDLLSSKNTTFTHVNRALIHMLLNIKESDMELYRQEGWAFYARVLGFAREKSQIMGTIKENGKIPLITKLAQVESIKKAGLLSEAGVRMINQDIYAGNLYETVKTDKFGQKFTHELQKQVEIL